MERKWIGFKRQELDTMVFNTFVFLQIFNEVNCRRLDNHLNIFAGIHKNNYFIVIFIIMVLFQALIIQFGGAAFETEKLNGIQWLICILLGMLSIPVGVIIRLIPEEIFGPLKNWVNLPVPMAGAFPTGYDGHGGDIGRVNSMPVSVGSNRQGSMVGGAQSPYPNREALVWNSAITKVRSELSVFKALRGGRLSADPKLGDRHVLHAGAMVPSLVATSVGAGWAPRTSGSAYSTSQADFNGSSPRSSMVGSRQGTGVQATTTTAGRS